MAFVLGGAIAGIGTLIGGEGAWVGPMVGGITAFSLSISGIPMTLIARSRLKDYEYMVANGRRVKAVVESVELKYVNPQAHEKRTQYWTVSAVGPATGGGERLYNQMIGKNKPNLRRGDQITIAVDPNDPGKYAMLLPAITQHVSTARPSGGTA